jgi:hypothetical protein
LNGFCETIDIYEREKGHKSFSLDIPYIVASRVNRQLIQNLCKDNYPVILEGVHCTGIMNQIKKENRKILVRLHNDECSYYRLLAASAKGLFKKIYYLNESRLLKKYQRTLPQHGLYAAISDHDVQSYIKQYHLTNTFHLPAFIPFSEVESDEGLGNFCLYHGNLSVAENEKAATWLLQNVFNKIKLPLVIAGKNPTDHLRKMVKANENTCLVADPTCCEMNDLVKKAQINVIPAFNVTGVKLKLLQAVFAGRHCVVTESAITGSGVDIACHVASNADAMASIIMQLFRQPFAEEEILLRKKIMQQHYDNVNNAETLTALLW